MSLAVAKLRRFVRQALGLSRFGFATPCGVVAGSHVACLCEVCHDRLGEVLWDKIDENEVIEELVQAGVVVVYANAHGVHIERVQPKATRSLRLAA